MCQNWAKKKRCHDLCEGLLTLEACSNIVSSLQNNKSPGNDGFTGEFYKAFWPIAGGLVVDSFNESYKKGKLTNSQRQAAITLLEKKDKNRAFLRNWRPISLLNIDYKIASKAIAQQKVLPSINHSDQCGYVSNRQIGDAVRTIADVMEYTKKHDLHGLQTSRKLSIALIGTICTNAQMLLILAQR